MKTKTTDKNEKITTIEKDPQKSTKSSSNLYNIFRFSFNNRLDNPTIRPMRTNDKNMTVANETVRNGVLLSETVLTESEEDYICVEGVKKKIELEAKERREKIEEILIVNDDDVFVGHVDDKGGGGGGGGGDGDNVGAVGLMCARLETNIDIRRTSFARTRSRETRRQGSGGSRTTTRTSSPSPWRRTRRATSSIRRRTMTPGGTGGTSSSSSTSYLSSAASLLGARGIQDHQLLLGTGTFEQTKLVEKAKLDQLDGKCSTIEQVSVANQCGRPTQMERKGDAPMRQGDIEGESWLGKTR